MEPERVDLSALDLATDQLRYERLVRRVMGAAGPELERRRTPRTALAVLGGWARPLLAAAAMVAVVAGGVLMATERDRVPVATGAVGESLGVPSPAADWLADGREPTKSDLVLAMERGRRP
jgi:hypothetical protein